MRTVRRPDRFRTRGAAQGRRGSGPAPDRHGAARRACGAERMRSPLDVHAAVVEAPVDLAVLLGLILNELLTHAFTYGTPGPRGARLVIACPIPE